MATAEAANEAIRKFNGYMLSGRALKVELSKPTPRSGGDYRSRTGSGTNRGRW
jgi:RNA recognition motif-containing protein